MQATDYAAFLRSKHVRPDPAGFEPGDLGPWPKPWQAEITAWACRMGRAGIWADCGLGKTLMQLLWADQVVRHTNGNVLILTPLAVARQTQREAEKFGIGPVTLCRSQNGVRPGINVTNYQMLGHFDATTFDGVVVDESDILANFTGKTKREIVSAFLRTPYKLDCSATPAPNDHMEIGNHSDFLGVMPGTEMLTRWFINDAGEAGNYRLKGHARDDFWRWVASWAVAVGRPSDLGHPDEGFDLPPLSIREHVAEVDTTADAADGFLFRVPSMSATSMHDEMRRTAEGRAAKVASLVTADRPWVVWCNTDYEAKAIRDAIPDVVEIRGPQPVELKEELIEGFTLGQINILLSKPAICGHGLNWQHCRDMAYVGLSYSYKQFYQSIRRAWRFGQTAPVTAHVVFAETEGRVLDSIRRKQADHEAMKREMIAAIVRFGLGARDARSLSEYRPETPIALPAWLN